MLETLALMGQGFINALVPVNLLAMAAGTTIGIVIGCLPGLSAAMGVALLLPMTCCPASLCISLPICWTSWL